VRLADWLQETTNILKQSGIDSARLDALILLEHHLKKTREWILAHEDDTIDSGILKKLNKSRVQREKREPLAYITGEKEFYGRKFYVDKNVLIPRPESEAIIDILKQFSVKNYINTVIDVGTGSGCLIISAGLELPECHLTALDISNEALRLANKNARACRVKIRFLQSDLLESMSAMPKTRPYIMLANLPYVPDDLITSEEITREPALALFSGDDGLDCYRKFWDQVSKLKNKPSAIITESLKLQHTPLKKLAHKAGYKLQKTNNLAQLFTHYPTT